MMIELKLEDYSAVKAFFDKKQQHIPAMAVLLGSYPGRVFTDCAAAPALAVVWATGRWMYAAGEIRSAEQRLGLAAFLQSIVIPVCRLHGEQWFEIYTEDSEAWTELLMSGLEGLKVHRHMESVYEFGREKFEQLERLEEESASISADSAAARVTVDLVKFPLLEDQDEVHFEVHNRFGGLTTIGAVVRAGEQLVSVCKNNGFTVNSRYFIDVDTYAEEQRGKGYATLAARSLIRYYLGQGRQPLWETTHENKASHKLALKLGFQPVESYPVFAFVIES
ncbi:GNAT family N-acetyltransferase [Paenibacillus sp. MMS20-IR301]|uniref:GNAT family N-acetyltransferase n=1 Tax=Paenibacillus sp. MMS20-IR301 TaxID=2895946 RepID=UPI0028E7A5E9|nr:GNAT family N-acetyltransferase [Paenibacillus sp. MMS20-IR301]WNS45378.1 GNAT family N-acetyltransferase [Paenibacillus sp. MMS20-IR301]